MTHSPLLLLSFLCVLLCSVFSVHCASIHALEGALEMRGNNNNEMEEMDVVYIEKPTSLSSSHPAGPKLSKPVISSVPVVAGGTPTPPPANNKDNTTTTMDFATYTAKYKKQYKNAAA